MKYIIIREYGENIIEAEDIENAVYASYDTHTGYDDIVAIVRIKEE